MDVLNIHLTPNNSDNPGSNFYELGFLKLLAKCISSFVFYSLCSTCITNPLFFFICKSCLEMVNKKRITKLCHIPQQNEDESPPTIKVNQQWHNKV